jgi:succinate dehydrogenase/fumarate reductase flavoprotein subunit
MKQTPEQIGKTEVKLTKLTEELKQIGEENDFNLKELKEKLKKLEEEFNRPSNISIKQDSSLFIKEIFVVISTDNCLLNNNERINI